MNIKKKLNILSCSLKKSIAGILIKSFVKYNTIKNEKIYIPQEKGNNFHPNIGIAHPLSTFDECKKKKPIEWII